MRQRGFTLVELMIVIAIVGILAAVMFGLGQQTYGASANNVSDQLTQSIDTAKMRAVSTRRIIDVEITPQQLSIWQSPTTGFVMPGAGTWTLVTAVTFASNISMWDVSSTVNAASGGTGVPSSANAALDYHMYFKPDGSSTGGTIFVTDSHKAKQWRVIVYKATGSSYAREVW